MDVVCFSFECSFNADGSPNCSTTIDPKYSDTTTSKPNPRSTPLITRPASHPTQAPSPSPTTHTPTTPVQTPSLTKPVTTRIPTAKPTSSHPPSQKPSVATTSSTPVPKPSPTKPITTRISTVKPTSASSHPPSQKTSRVTDITTTNISTSHFPMRPEVTSPSTPARSADGKSIYIPCSVVGFAVVVFLLVSIGIIRRHRNRRHSSDDIQPLNPECDLTFEDPQFLFNIQPNYVQPNGPSSNTDPTFSDVRLSADIDDTGETKVERIDLIRLSSEDRTAQKVDIEDVIFDRSTVRDSQREQDYNNSKAV